MTNYTMTTVTGALTIGGNASGTHGLYLPSISAGATITGAVSAARSAEIYDNAIITELDAATLIYGLTVAERAFVSQTLSSAWGVVLTQNMTVHDALTVVLGVVVLERLKISSVLAAQATYGVSMAELATINDGLWRMLSGLISDHATVTSALGVAYYASASIDEAAIITAALGNQLIMHVTVPEGAVLTDAELLQGIYQGVIVEGAVVTAAYVSPDGTFTTWAINTRTNAVSEYQNWVFNSFAKMGHKYLGMARDGLYELDGVDDEGASIPAYVKSGLFQPGGSRYSSFKAAYLGMRIDSTVQDVFLKIILGNDTEYVYKVAVQDMHTTRVNFGKGLRSRYYAWELMTTGEDFDLESVTFIPLVASRRVG